MSLQEIETLHISLENLEPYSSTYNSRVETDNSISQYLCKRVVFLTDPLGTTHQQGTDTPPEPPN